MNVILKVDEKVQKILSILPENYSEDEFLVLFKQEYPKDYDKCMKRFLDEERKTKPGKHYPMQHPDKHIKVALRSYLSRNKNNQTEEKNNENNNHKTWLADSHAFHNTTYLSLRL